jgi:hypothetical protein
MKHAIQVLQAILVLAAMLGMPSRVIADFVILKSGERREGRIISEDDQSVILRFRLTPKIFDTIKIQKSDIAQLIRETTAQIDFRENGLHRLLPSDDLMTATGYDVIIKERLQPFVAKHSESPEAQQAQQTMETMTEERNRVRAGALKFEGHWLDAESVKRERYEIDACRHRLAMKKMLGDSRVDPIHANPLAAIREFEKIQSAYPASLQYPAAIPEALKTLDLYSVRLDALERDQQFFSRGRNGATDGPVQDLLYRFQDAQNDRKFREQFDEQTRAGMKWRDVSIDHPQSIRVAQETVAAEKQSLEAIDLRALQFENENLGGARRCLIDGKDQEADTFLARLRPVKSTLVNRAVFDELEKMLATKQAR